MSIDWGQLVSAEDKVRRVEEAKRVAANTEARAYLASTDWYIIRLQETGQAVPDGVMAGRAAARASVTDSSTGTDLV